MGASERSLMQGREQKGRRDGFIDGRDVEGSQTAEEIYGQELIGFFFW